MEWPDKFLRAIPVGANLSKIIPQIVIWQFEDAEWGLHNTLEVKSDKAIEQVCKDLVALYRRKLDGGIVTDAEWIAVYDRAGAGAGAGQGQGMGKAGQGRGRGRGRGMGRAGAWANHEAYQTLATKLLQYSGCACTK